MSNAPLSQMSFARKLFLIFVFMFFGLLLASVIAAIVAQAVGTATGKAMQLCIMVLQNVVAFMVPAYAAVAIFSKRPWHALRATKAPGWTVTLLVLVMYVVALPMMNWVVEWNSHWPLPQALLDMEAQAKSVTDALVMGNSLPMMVAMVLVVGVLTAVGEEMMFHGALLGTWLDSRPAANPHVAVWTVAVVFSAFHMQFLGFVPRLLIGLWLGYLLLRTGSLWAPVLAHALNNGMVVVAIYLGEHGVLAPGALDAVGIPAAGQFPWLPLLSAAACLALLALLSRLTAKRRPR